MAIVFSCGTCGQRFRVNEDCEGKRSKCPKCGAEIQVPVSLTCEEETSQTTAAPPPLPVVPGVSAALRAIQTTEEDAEAKPTEPKNVGDRRIKKAAIPAAVLVVAIVLVSVIVVSFATPRHSPQSEGSGPGSLPALADPRQPELRDSSGSRYRFLSSDISKAFAADIGKDIFSVRLSRKVSKAVLDEISREILSNKPRNPQTGTRNRRTIIHFYLPEVDAFGPDGPFGGSWALVDINGPVLKSGAEIVVQGFTIDEEIKLLAKEGPPPGDVVGQWLEDSMGRGLWFICRRDGAFYLTQGGTFEQELVALGPQPFRIFERKEPTSSGEYNRINDRGDLEIRYNDGLYELRGMSDDRTPRRPPVAPRLSHRLRGSRAHSGDGYIRPRLGPDFAAQICVNPMRSRRKC